MCRYLSNTCNVNVNLSTVTYLLQFLIVCVDCILDVVRPVSRVKTRICPCGGNTKANKSTLFTPPNISIVNTWLNTRGERTNESSNFPSKIEKENEQQSFIFMFEVQNVRRTCT